MINSSSMAGNRCYGIHFLNLWLSYLDHSSIDLTSKTTPVSSQSQSLNNYINHSMH